MLLSLTMIVRDEEDVLEDCLGTVAGICDEMVVVDTGSADGTREIARRHGAQVIDVPWRGDFSAARNAALSAAHGDWALVLDADERFDGSRLALEPVLRRREVVALNVPILNLMDEGRQDNHSAIRIFRRLPGVRFERRLHEQVLPSIVRVSPRGRIALGPCRIRHIGYTRERVEKKGKSRRNLEMARREVVDAPDDAIAIYNLGVEHVASGEYEEGLAALRRVRHLVSTPYPWQSRLYKIEAQCLLQLGRPEEVVDILTTAVRHYPRFTDLYFILGHAHQILGNLREAERAFRRCLRLGPAETPPYDGVEPELGASAAAQALGSVLARRGRLGEARETLELAVRMRPGWMPAVQSLVECALLADADLDALSDRPPPDALQVGAALFRLGQYSQALRQFGRAERLHPNLPADHLHVKALAHLRAGDVDGARAVIAQLEGRAHRGARAYVTDLVNWAAGELSREALRLRYPGDHPIWNDVRPD